MVPGSHYEGILLDSPQLDALQVVGWLDDRKAV
jgi:hypothetical protein